MVDDEDRPLAVSNVPQDPILIRDCAMRPEITQKWKMYAAQILRPGDEGRERVDADAQDLGI
jgi:hypothetical protein